MKNRRIISLPAIALAIIVALALPVLALAGDAFGASAVTEGQTYTVEQMLTYAIQDEYLAQAEYQAIITTFEAGRPFVNIIKAEGKHIEHLLPLFEAYGVTVLENTAAAHVMLPASLEEVYAVGVTAEVNNINMYEAFLAQDNLPEDVRDVFEALKKASESHLEAFERNADKAGLGGNARNG